MCCGKPNVKEPDEAWYENVRAGNSVTTFGSEAEALKFLKRGIDATPEHLQPVYAALRFRWEQANG